MRTRYSKIIRDLFAIIPGKRFYVVQQYISTILSQLIILLPPIATAGIIAVITEKNFNAIWYYVFLYCIFYLLYFATLAWDMYTYRVLDNYYHNTVQQLLIQHVAENDSIFDEISQGHLSDSISEDVRWLVDAVDVSSSALAGSIQLVIIFIIFATQNLLVAFSALAIDIVYIVLMTDNSRTVARSYEGTRRAEDRVIDIVSQMLGNLRQIKSLNIVTNLNKKLDRTKEEWSEYYNKNRKAMMVRSCIMPIIVYGGKIALYIYLAFLVINGEMELNQLVLLISYFELVMTCTDTTLNNLLYLSNYGVRIKRIKAIFDFDSGAELNYGDLDNDFINGAVTFRNVYYDADGQDILKNISFKAFPNEITTLIGPPGSGKTTIINLLYRLDHVKSGSILIDDESIYNYSKKIYGSNVSGVFQNPFVFKMSIRDNLSLTNPDREAQESACRRVGLDRVIDDLPREYSTILDDNHRVLTNAEIQKLAIARALLSGAEILLFDEITSTIDPDSVDEIADILLDLKKDHTIILATHQPKLIALADKVVELDNGRVVRRQKTK